MLTNFTRRQYGLTAALCGLTAVGIYLFMIQVTLAHIQTVSGMVPFDMRPFGYSPDEAARLLTALEETGRAYYLTRQIPLDIVYPALLALTLISANVWFGSSLPNKNIIRAGAVFSIAAAVADYSENLGISMMLLGWPNLPDTLVLASSIASSLKAFLTTVAALITIFIAANWTRRKYLSGR